MRITLRSFPLIAALLLACGDASTAPGNVAGSYHATEFSVTENGQTRDLLAAGSTIQISLLANETMTGSLHLVDPLAGTLNASMNGAWLRTGDDVTFEQNADTFMRDLTFRATRGLLKASDVFSEATVVVTLKRD